MNYIKLIIVGLLINSFMLYSQQPLKFKSGRKVPRVSILFTGSFGYVFSSANGTGRDFSSWYKPEGGNIFNSRNLGMQDGFGLGITGKYAVSKNKKFGLTGNLGYNHFYNSEDRGMNRTRWNIFNLGAGVEYNFTPKQKESVFIGYQLLI
jgi:hypothetical protein